MLTHPVTSGIYGSLLIVEFDHLLVVHIDWHSDVVQGETPECEVELWSDVVKEERGTWLCL